MEHWNRSETCTCTLSKWWTSVSLPNLCAEQLRFFFFLDMRFSNVRYYHRCRTSSAWSADLNPSHEWPLTWSGQTYCGALNQGCQTEVTEGCSEGSYWGVLLSIRCFSQSTAKMNHWCWNSKSQTTLQPCRTGFWVPYPNNWQLTRCATVRLTLDFTCCANSPSTWGSGLTEVKMRT